MTSWLMLCGAAGPVEALKREIGSRGPVPVRS